MRVKNKVEMKGKGKWETNGKLVTNQCTMVEKGKKHRQNSHLINHCLTSEGVSKVSK